MLIKENNGTNYIGVNKNHFQTRQRFSIAHEIGHYLLGHDDDNVIDDYFDKPIDKEQEANKFASELLMPIEFLKKDIASSLYNIPSLAKRYLVSEQVASIRLLETNLINKMKPLKK
jgi:Zn-dependent peptidase ImmA (M78 family)